MISIPAWSHRAVPSPSYADSSLKEILDRRVIPLLILSLGSLQTGIFVRLRMQTEASQSSVQSTFYNLPSGDYITTSTDQVIYLSGTSSRDYLNSKSTEVKVGSYTCFSVYNNNCLALYRTMMSWLLVGGRRGNKARRVINDSRKTWFS